MNTIRFFGRPVSILLIVVLLAPFLLPNQSYALTSATPQEIAEYEPPGATDMVNLLTGDFQYSIPLLNVPGRDGGFSLPLSYHAGISMEQDASWVGLGWSLNPGAILRGVSEYPDDAFGATTTNTAYDEGITGYHVNALLYQRTRIGNSMGGYVGLSSILQIGFGSKSGNASILGMGTENSVSQNVIGLASSVLSIGMGGMGGFVKDLAIGAAMEVGIGVVVGGMTATASGGGFTSSDWTMESKGSSLFGKRSFRYYLDQTRSEKLYGALYLQDIPLTTVPNYEVVDYLDNVSEMQRVGYATNYSSLTYSADAHQAYDGSGSYYESNKPVSVAYDSYQVQGATISGAMQPYRLDVGAVPKGSMMGGAQFSFMPVDWTDTKVQFRFLGTASNSYTYHSETETSGYTTNTGLSDQFPAPGSWRVTVDSKVLGHPDERIELDRINGSGDRSNSLENGRLIHGRNVEWFTHNELTTAGPASAIGSGRIVDHLPLAERQAFRSGFPIKGIGGFSVTGVDGMSYHYTLPVLNLNQLSTTGCTDIPYCSSESSYSKFELDQAYATAWLLTTITGPDFVDRNGNGIADSEDWGDWVRFEYGKFSSNYQYRYPYRQNGGIDPGSWDFSPGRAFREVKLVGTREAYYLNRIHTNTHSALFLKSLRDDGRGAYDSGVVKPSSTLKLDEIIVLENKDYERLIGSCSDCFGLGDFSLPHDRYADIHPTVTGDTFDGVLDSYEITQAMRDFLKNRQVVRQLFNYTYELCPGTWNSFTMSATQAPPSGSSIGNGGKLTLRSIGQYGPSDIKLMPDYMFGYNGPNPGFNRTKADGWGMHCSSCGTNVNGPSLADQFSSPPGIYANTGAYQATSDGAAWSLTDIVTPTGAELHVEYERDVYASVFGEPTSLSMYLVPQSTVDRDVRTFEVASNIDLTGYPFMLEKPQVDVSPVVGHCGCGPSFLAAGTNAYVKVMNPYTLQYFCTTGDCDWGQGTCQLDQSCGTIIDAFKRIAIRTKGKYGGDIRVKRVVMREPFTGQELETFYTYTADGSPTGASSGSVTIEPDLCLGKYGGYKDLYDVPRTPVMYNKVTVRSVDPSSVSDKARTVFTFRAPTPDMIETTSVQEAAVPIPVGSTWLIRTRWNHNVKVNTSGIGDLLSKEDYDHKGYLDRKMELSYASEVENNLAHFTQGAVQCDLFIPNSMSSVIYRLARTTKHFVPSIPVATTITTQGSEQTVENTKFDFLTGTVLESAYKDSWGNRYRTKVVPAYKRYPGMGSKALDPSNANLMGLPAEDYLFAEVNGEERPLSVGISTYSKDWSYPVPNAGEPTYTSSSELWHPKGSFVWKDALATDGTYAQFVPYDFTPGAVQDPRWVSTGRTTKYDHESRVVEVADINDQYSATLYGMDGRFVIASGTFATLNEIRYSGAEDRVPGMDVFEGNLSGALSVSTGSFAHTGNSSLKLTPGEQGFLFQAELGSGTPGSLGRKDYRASVWVHERNLARARLFFHGLNANGVPVPGGSGSVGGEEYKFKAGKWYLLELKIPASAVQSASSLQVGVENDASGYSNVNDDFIYLDDMRFHPYMGNFTSNVYDPRTGNLLATLDDDNRAVQYTYDALGRVIMVEVETANGFVPSKTYEHKFMR